jgi:predicted enzyme related to lactoylglutathione lyase
VIIDPLGHRWMLQTPLSSAPRSTVAWHEGDVACMSLWVPDVEGAATFFATVLGWTYGAGSSEQGRQVEGTTIPHGLYGGQERSTLFCCYAVDDVDAAVERVRAAGGSAAAPSNEPYGRVANCTDDQDTPFAIVELAGNHATEGGERPRNGVHQGDVVRHARSRRQRAGARLLRLRARLAFQSGSGRGLLGRRRDPPDDESPRRTRTRDRRGDVPGGRHRRRGGAGARGRRYRDGPERQPYGIAADCVDDQGTRFWLGQL